MNESTEPEVIKTSLIASKSSAGVVKNPEYVWKCGTAPNWFWMREKGQQPNAFHRLMQRIFFGFKWERIKEQPHE